MSVSKEQMEKLVESLAKESLLENFVYGLIEEYAHWDEFRSIFSTLADEQLHPENY